MATKTKKPMHPLFEKYGLGELHDKTGYSYMYLNEIQRGKHPATQKFRRFMASVLRKPQSELFNEENA